MDNVVLRHMVARGWSVIAALTLAGVTPACTGGDRAACEADDECPGGQLCYVDDLCLPTGVIKNRGEVIGSECVVNDGRVFGCDASEICRMGFCVAPAPDGDAVAEVLDTASEAETDPSSLCTAGSATNRAPLFGGVSEAWSEGPNAIGLRWIEAADETLPEAIAYHVYLATASGAQDFGAPVATVVGQTSTVLAGLTTETAYFVVVRARDAEGQIDCNAKEASATPRAAPTCIDYASEIQSVFDANCVGCHKGDDAPRGLRLTSYEDAVAGGEGGSIVTACQPDSSLLYLKVALASPPSGERMPKGGPYFSDSRLALMRQWIAEGARESCALPDPCGDTMAPTFGGLESATLDAGETSATICWAAGSDETTPAEALVYDLYQGTGAGEEDLSFPAVTSEAGATCAQAVGLMPDTTYCWVARARDAAGNASAPPLVERCVTTPPSDCIDYAGLIQPLLSANCAGCHSGAGAPRGLQLTSYDVLMAGGQSGSAVTACQSDASLLYQKVAMESPPIGSRMPLGGPYLEPGEIALVDDWIRQGARESCAGANPCSDAAAPTFGGLETAVLDAGETSATICWAAGSDETTPAEALVYDLYQGKGEGAEDLSFPAVTSEAGATCAQAVGLMPDTTYCWVARARDAAGNVSAPPLVERCVTTPPSDCIDYASLIQPLLSANCAGCHSGAGAPRGLQLTSYDALMAGGQSGKAVTACQSDASLLYQKVALASPPIGSQMPLGGPYLEAGETDLIDQWISEGARASCAVANPCSDAAAPTFGGLETAVLDAGETSATICWAAGSDETTPAEALVYDLYQGKGEGAEDLSFPAVTSEAGATCAQALGLMPDTTYCWVARARDAAGNASAPPLVERCVTTPPSDCIDYASLIQPLLSANCAGCHSGAGAPRGLQLTSYDALMAGGASGKAVTACQTDASLLYQKVALASPPIGSQMPLGGPYLEAGETDLIDQWISEGARASCALADPCSDATAPTFGGLATATLDPGNASATLCWAAGSDNATPVEGLLYDVYQGIGAGNEDLGFPSSTSTPGATCAKASGLMPDTTYCWVARARDGAGNVSAPPLVERCVTTPAAACIDFATVVQPILTERCSDACHKGATAPRHLALDTLEGILAGGDGGDVVTACSPASSMLVQKLSETPPFGARMPYGGPYLSAAEIGVITRWVDEGTRASCASADPCSDSAAPTFDGLESATALDATHAELCWSSAADDLTPPEAIKYNVYQGDRSGAENFARVATTVTNVTADTTCVEIAALSPSSTHCWIVRAADGAANEDQNTRELCATQPTLPGGCVDYETMVQPLLDKNCTRCHAGNAPPQWLRLDSYEQVITGSVRRNLVVACNSATSLLINKVGGAPSPGKRMPLDGPPYLTSAEVALLAQWIDDGARRSCEESPACGDKTRPLFGGVQSVDPVDATTLRVCWNAATDNHTPAESMLYQLWETGMYTTGLPAAAVTGETCLDVNVGTHTNMCFIVRARDLAGNMDLNSVRELCAETPAADCVDYATLVQPILSARCTHCHKDNLSSARQLDLQSYAGVRTGGVLRNTALACNWTQSFLNTKTSGSKCGRQMPLDGPPYLSPAERSILETWVTAGAREDCAAASPCGDVAAPVFAGVTRITEIDASTVDVCWDPATDDTTAAAHLRYELYDAASPGDEDFTAKAPYAVSGGATCRQVSVPTGQETCFVVRARDLAGNLDTNVVEACHTTTAECFAYDDVVQPVLTARCAHCHSGQYAPAGLRWDSYTGATAGSNWAVRPCRADNSKIIDEISECSMPADTQSGYAECKACISDTDIRIFTQWIDEGAAARDCPWGTCPR